MIIHEGTNLLNIALVPVVIAQVGDLEGIVTDAVGGDRLEGVKVTINGQTTFTDSIGRYGFQDLPVGTYTLTFEADGYETGVF